jgi:hypothetical protein
MLRELFVPAAFVIFATAFLLLTIYNDVAGHRAAIAAGRPGIINCAMGVFVVLLGTPVYLFYRLKRSRV